MPQNRRNSENNHNAGVKKQIPPRIAAQRAAIAKRKKAKMKAYKRRVTLVTVAAVFCVIGVVAGIYNMLNSAFASSGGELPSEVNTPAELKKDVVNFLICGIDYEDGRNYGANMGMTDVILYVSLDVKAGKINILQIPRDTYIGDTVATGGTGKINAVLYNSAEEPAIAGLAKVIHQQFGLPIDYYITIDMDAFKEIINVLGGIDVYVPERMELDGNVLEPGLQHMDGATAEFFVRYRNFPQADIKRLEMQRYFYAAVFNKLISFPPQDVVKVLPAYMKYVQTDMNIAKIGSVFMKVMDVQKEDIVIYKVPGEAITHNGHSVYTVHLEMMAQRINEGFKPYATPITVADLGLIELAHTNDYITGEGTPLAGLDD